MTTTKLTDTQIQAMLDGCKGVTPGPYRTDKYSTDVWAADARGGDTKLCDIRGWGYLTGKGHGALGLSEVEAVAIQKANAAHIARCDPETIAAAMTELIELRADIKKLSDPHAVHINMLRGTIAKPTFAQIKHLYPEAIATGDSAIVEACAKVTEAEALLDCTDDPSDAAYNRAVSHIAAAIRAISLPAPAVTLAPASGLASSLANLALEWFSCGPKPENGAALTSAIERRLARFAPAVTADYATLCQVLDDIYNELGCEHDNEAALEAIYTLKNAPAVTLTREQIARAISLSYGEDPDDDAPTLRICGPNNEPMPNWRFYEEQAGAIFTAQRRVTLTLEQMAEQRDAARYRWLRTRDLETVANGGVFAGVTPDNVVINLDDLDRHVDDAILTAQRGAAVTRPNCGGMAARRIRALSSPAPAVTVTCDVETTEGGRSYIERFFREKLHRHDFTAYIRDTLAGDFACALSQHLASQPLPAPAVTLTREQIALAEMVYELVRFTDFAAGLGVAPDPKEDNCLDPADIIFNSVEAIGCDDPENLATFARDAILTAQRGVAVTRPDRGGAA